MADVCPDCGAAYALVGRMHRCPGRKKPPPADYSDEVTDETLAALEELVKDERDASGPLEKSAAHSQEPSSNERVYRWREKNRERYNEAQRDLMRRRRAGKG